MRKCCAGAWTPLRGKQKSDMKQANKKKTKRNRKNQIKVEKKVLKGAIAVLAVIIIIAAVIFISSMMKEKSEENYDRENSLGNGIYIEDSAPYTGVFWEDGSDTQAEDVWSLTVVNTSEKDIRYLKICAETEEAKGEFEVTTLPAGAEIVVLERSAASFPGEDQSVTYEAANLAFFQEELSVMTDSLALYGQDNWLKVENISEESIDKNICVYYKNIKDGVLQGGITYRAVFSGGVPSGESKEQEVIHYRKDSSQVMYVTCGQDE